MKVVASVLLILFASSYLYAQSEAGVADSNSLEVIKFSWSKVRIGWERDPFGGPVENFDEMRSRARNEKRVAAGGGDRAKRDAKADEANLALLRQKGPPKYFFLYKARIKNNGTTAITELDWDYVFFERGTNNELGRQEFTSDEQIGAGKTKELAVRTISPPTHTVSLTSLNLNEREQFSEKIMLVRIKFADGRIWQAH